MTTGFSEEGVEVGGPVEAVGGATGGWGTDVAGVDVVALCKAPKSSIVVETTRLLDSDVLLDGAGGVTFAPPSAGVAATGDVALLLFFDLRFGLNRIPVGCPSGLWIRKPDDGVVPSFSEKYSILLGMDRGEGGIGGGGAGGGGGDSTGCAAGLTEEFEFALELGGRVGLLVDVTCEGEEALRGSLVG